MRKRESARRNILLLISVFVAATALIVLVPFLRPSIPSAPPEPPELSAKRFAPENAFQTLIEAAKLIPTQQRESAFAQARASMLDQCRQDPLARLLHSPFPEEDTVEFLRMPALAKMRQALAKPYFLLPIAWKEDAGNWRTLARVPRRRRSNEPPSDNGLFSKEF